MIIRNYNTALSSNHKPVWCCYRRLLLIMITCLWPFSHIYMHIILKPIWFHIGYRSRNAILKVSADGLIFIYNCTVEIKLAFTFNSSLLKAIHRAMPTVYPLVWVYELNGIIESVIGRQAVTPVTFQVLLLIFVINVGLFLYKIWLNPSTAQFSVVFTRQRLGVFLYTCF